MAKKVIMPALGMAMQSGILVSWLKKEGDVVKKGDALIEIETDKTTVEFEAQADGILGGIRASAGQEVPVGETLAWLLAPGEEAPAEEKATPAPVKEVAPPVTKPAPAPVIPVNGNMPAAQQSPMEVSPLARNIAQEHGIDLSRVPARGGRIQKEDVLAYIESSRAGVPAQTGGQGLVLASPKARRLAGERGLNLAMISGSGPEGAVLAEDVDRYQGSPGSQAAGPFEMTRAWRIMADRMTQSWTSVPHFFLLRQVNATRFAAWLESARQRTGEKITYTDLLVKVAALSLRQHPRANAAWINESIQINPNVNVGIAVATEEALIVPVIHNADQLSVAQIAARRKQIVERAKNGKLSLDDLQGGTFTISNLGMYGVDAFNAIVNTPQAAILAVGRISEQVMPVNGVPMVQPMMNLSLSNDHRVIDGARAAQFLDMLANFIEEPLRYLDF